MNVLVTTLLIGAYAWAGADRWLQGGRWSYLPIVDAREMGVHV